MWDNEQKNTDLMPLRKRAADPRASRIRHMHDSDASYSCRSSELNVDLAIDQTKIQFLANMNHELRTPLMGLMGAAELLGTTDLTEEQQHYLHIFQSSSQKLLGVVNDVLDYSKLTTGQLRLFYAEFELRSLLHEAVTHFQPFAERKGISLSFSMHPGLPKLYYGDEKRLSQILSHLLANAIKFTHSGSVHLDASREDGQILLRVKDSGIGMSAEAMAHIFEPFFQAENGNTRSFGGTGIGLAITRCLVSMMRGEITVASDVNKGSEFFLRLPYLESLVEHSSVGEWGQATTHVPNAKILLVEDNEINQAIVFLLLKKKGLQIDIAQDGLEGIELHQRNHYDLIFMDMQMPVMDGMEATREIRRFDDKVQIVALSANLVPELQAECLRVGMNDCLAKPLDQTCLEKVLNKLACH